MRIHSRMMRMMQRLHDRNEWKFFSVLPKASHGLAAVWWLLVGLRGVLPAVFAIAMGIVVRSVQHGESLISPLLFSGVVFVLLQILAPIHQSVGANLGDRTAAWLYDRLTEACVRPTGMGHLEDPKLTGDLSLARDFDLGMMGPPISISMDFIAGGLVEMTGGVASAAVLAWYRWWAPLVLAGAWLATHWLLRESALWQYEATRLREKPVVWSLLLVVSANVLVFWSLANAAISGSLDLGAAIVFAQCALGTSMIAFGGLNWALDWAASPVAAVLRLQATMNSAGALRPGSRRADSMPRSAIRFRHVTFAYPSGGGAPVLKEFDLTIPAGSSIAIVGRNGAGKTTLAKLLCRLYDPQSGAIEVDGVDIREFDLENWRSRVTAVFQDFIRFELPLRDNVAPQGAPDDHVLAALASAGAGGLAKLDTILARGYEGGTDLSGGQWQRVALARALCAVRLGAGVVLLDEPTAQLDVRGEAEIFDRILAATRHCTTILISHRFSTVRHAGRICVLENGAVVELGTHDELMALGGRYRTMFDMQAQRFNATEDEEGMAYDVLA